MTLRTAQIENLSLTASLRVISEDLSKREGLREVWDALAPNTREEIVRAWARHIHEVFKRLGLAPERSIASGEIADLELAVAQLQRVKRELRAAGVFVPDEPERNLTREQHSLLVGVAGLDDQIQKGHYLNVHFRAFQLSHQAWQEHIRQNAMAGAERYNSPPGAVLDDTRSER